MIKKAIFLDRDGIINIDKGYVYKIEDFEFCEDIFDTLKYLKDLGYLLFIITNQSGINRKYYSENDFLKLTKYMLNELKNKNINILDVQFCPHTPSQNCECRKPKTKMIENILQKYPKIDLNNSWLIGDKDSDINCAKNAKIKNTILFKSKDFAKDLHSAPSFCISNLREIKSIILL